VEERGKSELGWKRNGGVARLEAGEQMRQCGKAERQGSGDGENIAGREKLEEGDG
jgi:hypothetical protein